MRLVSGGDGKLSMSKGGCGSFGPVGTCPPRGTGGRVSGLDRPPLRYEGSTPTNTMGESGRRSIGTPFTRTGGLWSCSPNDVGTQCRFG